MEEASMQAIQPSQIPVPTAAFVPGLKHERLVFVSGQVAIDFEGKAKNPDDMRAQTEQVLQHVKWIVEEAGGSLNDVIKTTVFLTQFDDYRVFDDVYTEFFGEHKPAREVVQAGLLRPGLVIELSAIAILPS
jgi:2-iminobutanoate/2-iminopropanoate deaminase